MRSVRVRRGRPVGGSPSGLHVLVMAKEPVPGRVKTRLCPPLSPGEAAEVAEAALADTLEVVARCGADRRILALDGHPGPWLPDGFEVVAQRGVDLAARLAAAWSDAAGPGVQIGMDTPQVTPALLDGALAAVEAPGSDAVAAALGLADDGGWWAIGLGPGWTGDVFAGVPMSAPGTGAAQLARLEATGHRVTRLPELRDVDTFADALAVARSCPGTRFATVVERLSSPVPR